MLHFDTLINILLLACCLHLLWLRHRVRFKRWLEHNKNCLPRQWKPKSPHSCYACLKAFASRKGTPLYYLKTAVDTVDMVLWFLTEGVDRSVLIRYTRHLDSTIARWLTRVGNHNQRLHNCYFRNLTFALIQMDEDELHAKVRNCSKARWLAIDPVSKALSSRHVGSRQADSAYTLVHDLKLRLAHGYVHMTISKRSKLFDILKVHGFNPTIQTAFIERVN